MPDHVPRDPFEQFLELPADADSAREVTPGQDGRLDPGGGDEAADGGPPPAFGSGAGFPRTSRPAAAAAPGGTEETPRELRDRWGRVWRVCAVESPPGGAGVRLLFAHETQRREVGGCPRLWRELPGSRLLALAGIE